MAKSGKFLPFITNGSSELSIFKALIQRTKGSTKSAVTNLFSIILSLGIAEVRARMDNMSQDLTTSDKIKELISENTAYHIPKSEQIFWTHLKAIKNIVIPDSTDYSKEEEVILFTVMAVLASQSKLVSIGFNYSGNHELFRGYSKEDFDLNTVKLESIKLAGKDSERVGFFRWEEFKAYIVNKEDTLNNTKSKITVLPVKMSSDVYPTLSDYEMNHCTSPYQQG